MFKSKERYVHVIWVLSFYRCINIEKHRYLHEVQIFMNGASLVLAEIFMILKSLPRANGL